MFGKLNPDEIEVVLSRQIVGHLGIHADDITYVVPISYAYDGNYLYGRSLPGKKIDMMRKNNRVCFQVEMMQDMANWKSIIAWGEFEELNDTAGRNIALRKLLERNLPLVSSETTHLTPQWPFPADDPASIDGIVFRIRLNEKSGRFENYIP